MSNGDSRSIEIFDFKARFFFEITEFNVQLSVLRQIMISFIAKPMRILYLCIQLAKSGCQLPILLLFFFYPSELYEAPSELTEPLSDLSEALSDLSLAPSDLYEALSDLSEAPSDLLGLE